MHVEQHLSILFYRKMKKGDTRGMVTIYVRITIDGVLEEMSTGLSLLPLHWDNATKMALDCEPDYKAINKRIGQIKADLEKHFDLMQTKHGFVTPALIKASYKKLASGSKTRNEKLANIELSESVDILIGKYLSFWEKLNRAYQNGFTPGTDRLKLLEIERKQIGELIDEQVKNANLIFDKPNHRKTFVMLINEYLLDFIQLSFTNNRSPNTLEKWIGRKKRYIEFLKYRYSVEDILLNQIEYKFIDEVYKYLLVQHRVIPNTATKYTQCIKQLMDRAVAKGWIHNNVFVMFKCRYTDPHHDWLTMQELERLKDTDFGQEKLNVIRDIFLFSSFTGFSYREAHTLKPSDIITGIDCKKWISKSRQKTGGDETLPLLPLPLQLLDKYKNHPLCLRRGCLLPVPTNEHYNRCLKEISKIGKFNLILKTHKARYFFANEVAYNNGVPLKTVSKMLGHKSVKTTEIYVRANRQNVSENMEMVEKKMFDQEGRLKNHSILGNGISNPIPANPIFNTGAKVIQMKKC